MDDGRKPGSEWIRTAHIPGSESHIVRHAVRSVLEGNREAFRHLVDLYGKRIFGLTLFIVRNPSGAEEATQDTFAGAYTHINRYDPGRPFYPWLATIATRHAQTWLRKHSRRAEREGGSMDSGKEVSAKVTNPLDMIIADERSRDLWHLVAKLPSGQRTVVILYYRHEMKVDAIAQAMGVTSGTVKTLLFRARRALRRNLSDDMYPITTGYGEEIP